jgi:peptide/nickel transport system substrate-binding protein
LFLFAAFLVACQEDNPPPAGTPEGPAAAGTPTPDDAATIAPTEAPQPTPTITATPRPPKDMVVCLGGEPADLYLYGDSSVAATAVRHAIYESLVTSLGYNYQATALETLPTLADGVRIETVTVDAGQPVVTTGGEVAPLGPGITVMDAAGQAVVYAGEPLQLAQLVVDFTFRPLVWSDGEPVTAEDSVFSFQVAGDRDTPAVDRRVRYTAAYEATGERSLRWTGLPGYVDQDYAANVWTPLPSHQLAGFSPAELPVLDEAARAPLSYGPFVVEEWTPGESIRLTPNPHYYRATEGLPYLTSLTFRFLVPNGNGLPAGYEGCHVLTHDLLSFDALPAVEEAGGALVEHLVPTGVVEQIIFGIDRAGSLAETWFQDVRVRQAIAHCTNRQALIDEFTYGRAVPMDSYVSPDHPLTPGDLPSWPYDPAAGNALLDQVGLLDATGDGFRDSLGATETFSVTLGTNAESILRQTISERVRDDLAACGIQVNPAAMEAGTWFATGPVGPVFGRRFDLAAFAWFHRLRPDCSLYTTAAIPGPVEEGFAGWQGVNVSGWSNEAYDAACRTAQRLLPEQPGYVEAHQEAMRLFAQELPALPLFTRLRLAATTPDVLNFRLDPTQPSELWNVFEWDLDLDGP